MLFRHPPRAVLLAAAVWSSFTLGACGEDKRPGSDTTDTTDPDTVTDTTGDTSSCDGLSGTANCPCRTDLTCDSGLVCANAVCVPETRSGLVLPAGARGCEVLLEEAGKVSDVRFTGVRGTFVREAPRVAVAVTQETDADFAAGSVEVLGSGSPVVTVVSARCVDTTGAVIPNATVTLQ